MQQKTVLKAIELAQQGDQQAFSMLVRHYQHYLRGFLASRMSSASEVDDLCQEAFVVAYRKINQLTDAKVFKTWLTSIAINLLRNYNRKHATTLTAEHATLEKLIDDRLAEQAMPTSFDFSALRHCLLKLKQDARLLLQKHYVDELTVKELTAEFNVKHSTITMRLHRLRRKLHDCIELNQQ